MKRCLVAWRFCLFMFKRHQHVVLGPAVYSRSKNDVFLYGTGQKKQKRVCIFHVVVIKYTCSSSIIIIGGSFGFLILQ